MEENKKEDNGKAIYNGLFIVIIVGTLLLFFTEEYSGLGTTLVVVGSILCFIMSFVNKSET
tara:strand:- start:216 stop:398 length:183 start_codon:yes stop_codon:yes gene_type:complete